VPRRAGAPAAHAAVPGGRHGPGGSRCRSPARCFRAVRCPLPRLRPAPVQPTRHPSCRAEHRAARSQPASREFAARPSVLRHRPVRGLTPPSPFARFTGRVLEWAQASRRPAPAAPWCCRSAPASLASLPATGAGTRARQRGWCWRFGLRCDRF
jgi:hypothetical protein